MRKEPRQARSLQTFETILDGAFQLLLRENPEKISVVKIAERAGVSVGTVYQYFECKDAILGALVGRYVDAHLEKVQRAAESLQGAPMEEFLDGLIRVLIRSYSDNVNLSRIVLGRMPLLAFEDRRNELDRMVRAHLHAQLEELGLPIHHPRSEVSIYVFTRAILGPIWTAVIEGSPHLDSPEFETSIRWIGRTYSELFYLRP
ncbi:MAG TPA: TetR/AcrR family transcriptional regulator, partial [Bdellovibrionota bacterium]|nr:TetR/AcrR family transcriptional regulator [Bdellovibrionota bacterium]